ncbi:MAG: dihydrolipoyl dehydrogenase [Acidimicrobiia bacterium]
MVVGEISSSIDVLVIGGGPGGYTAALKAASLGKSVTLVERGAIGGVCLNVGCIPSKALIRAARVYSTAHEGASIGVDASASIDLAVTQRWIAGVVEQLTGDVAGLLRRAKVNVVIGTAHFTRRTRAVIAHGDGVEHVEFDTAIVATGSRPIELEVLPFDRRRVIDSTDALRLTSVPSQLVVVGGGYIGVELACAYRRLGSAVAIVEQADRVLPSMYEPLGRVVQRDLAARGVEVVTGAVVRGDDGRAVHLDDGRSLAADIVLVAVGRRPNTDDVGLAAAGVQLDDRHRIDVDSMRRSRSAPSILAVGDVTAGPALAHKAMVEADVAGAVAAGKRAAFDPACIPEVVFADPEVVSVGLTPGAAVAAGLDVVTRRRAIGSVGRALVEGTRSGYFEIVADRDGGTVRGVHIAGPGVSELSGEAALAIEMGATLDDLALTAHAHPTMSELFR